MAPEIIYSPDLPREPLAARALAPLSKKWAEGDETTYPPGGSGGNLKADRPCKRFMSRIKGPWE